MYIAIAFGVKTAFDLFVSKQKQNQNNTSRIIHVIGVNACMQETEIRNTYKDTLNYEIV